MNLELKKIILSTMSHGKTIAKNIISLYIGEIISQVLAFFLVIAIAHHLGQSGLGKYSFAISFVSILLVLADMGLPTLITKEVAKDKSLAKLHLTKTFTLKLLLNSATLVITILAILSSRKDYETILIVALAAVAMFFYNLAGIYRAIFQAYEVLFYEASLKVIERVIAVSLGIFLLYRGYGILSLFLILVFSNAVYYLIIYVSAKTRISKVSLSIDKNSWKQSLKNAMPFWITIVFTIVYFKVDTIMLGFMKDFAAVGIYNAALKIIEVITRIPFLLIISVFPALAKFHKLSYDKTNLLYKKSFYYMALLALPIATGLIMLAGKIIGQLFSPEFKDSALVLQILAASLIFVFVNYLMGYLLNAIDRQKLFTLTITITTVINIVMNLLLIPKFSYLGAAIATLISEIINFGMLYYFTSKDNFGINLAKFLPKPILATIVMAILIWYSKSLHLFLVTIISAIAYFSVLLIIKGIGKEEINMLQSIIKK